MGKNRTGFRFPAVGSRLTEDARYRDFSFNALLYDTLKHEVFDACGTGLADLLGETRRFAPLEAIEDPLKQAMIVLRAAKFVLRWSDSTQLNLAPLHSWIATLPWVWLFWGDAGDTRPGEGFLIAKSDTKPCTLAFKLHGFVSLSAILYGPAWRQAFLTPLEVAVRRRPLRVTYGAQYERLMLT